MKTIKLSRLTQTAIGPKTVEFENIVQQALVYRKCQIIDVFENLVIVGGDEGNVRMYGFAPADPPEVVRK